MAGAEGFEPSARGFGVAVDIQLLRKVHLLPQAPTELLQHNLHVSDAQLMLSCLLSSSPPHRTVEIIPYPAAFVNPLFSFFKDRRLAFQFLTASIKMTTPDGVVIFIVRPAGC